MELIIRILLAVSSAAAFGYGVFRFFRPKVALFKQLVVSAVGCMMMGRIYDVVTLLIRGDVPTDFNLGFLGPMGGLLFIFSASYGQMDGLVDNKSPELRKYRLIPLAAPAAALVALVPILMTHSDWPTKIMVCLNFVFISLASYYNLKHLIIPDVEYGIISSIRSYSLVALILSLMQAYNFLGLKLESNWLSAASSIALIILYPLLIIETERGSRKWTI